MEIRRKQDSNLTRLGDVQPGEVFEQAGSYYIRTSRDINADGNVLHCDTGILYRAESYDMVRVLRGAFVEE